MEAYEISVREALQTRPQRCCGLCANICANFPRTGVPIVRLQKLLGHATAVMTMRYMKHAPEAYLDQDAAAIASHLAGADDAEAVARAEAARQELRKA